MAAISPSLLPSTPKCLIIMWILLAPQKRRKEKKRGKEEGREVVREHEAGKESGGRDGKKQN